jgi:hypothetical protein
MMSLCLSIGTSGWISCQLSVVSCQLSVTSGQWSVVSGGCVWEGESSAEPQGGVAVRGVGFLGGGQGVR